MAWGYLNSTMVTVDQPRGRRKSKLFKVAMALSACLLTGASGGWPEGATADVALVSWLEKPQPSKTTDKQASATISSGLFRAASLNLRTLVDRGHDAPQSGAPESFLFDSGSGAAFSMAPLNLRSVMPEPKAWSGINQLKKADVKRYQQIFKAQEQNDWDQADHLITTLEDRDLLGHVQFQRLMNPKSPRASFEQLRDWMQSYADHPEADRVYRLALSRRPANADTLPRPRNDRGIVGNLESYGLNASTAQRDSDEEWSENNGWQGDLESYAANGQVNVALRQLDQADKARSVSKGEFDTAQANVAAAAYYGGDLTTAQRLSEASARNAGASMVEARWTAGLTAWRMREYARAATHFTSIVRANRASAMMHSASAYWAARAWRRMGEGGKVRQMLIEATRYPGTFYGLLAARTLGRAPDLNWQTPPLDASAIKRLSAENAGRRALKLLQTGRPDLAELELKGIRPNNDPALERALIAAAEDAGLPALAIRLGSALQPRPGKRYDAALYPVPPWMPNAGFQVDRALIFGFMRQESRFDPQARSNRGATGLMQLMPRTASYMSDEGDQYHVGKASDALLEPRLNIELGQRYLSYLLENEGVERDILLLTAAYNAGPGNLQRWRQTLDYQADPLLFIESIPIRETRHFVQRVATNIWMYRMRLNQPTPDLDALAAGRRPIYQAMDSALKLSTSDKLTNQITQVAQVALADQ